MTTSVAVRTVGGSPIYPRAIGASMFTALFLVRSLDRCTVVIMRAHADSPSHTVGVAKFGIRSHAYTPSALGTI